MGLRPVSSFHENLECGNQHQHYLFHDYITIYYFLDDYHILFCLARSISLPQKCVYSFSNQMLSVGTLLREPFLPMSTGLVVVILSNQARMCSSLRLLLRCKWESDFNTPNMDGSNTVQMVRKVSPTFN